MEQICAVCCGTKREIEIDCPSNCAYLRSGRDYEAESAFPIRTDGEGGLSSMTSFPDVCSLIDAVLSAVVAVNVENRNGL
jgi:hypothetical protein